MTDLDTADHVELLRALRDALDAGVSKRVIVGIISEILLDTDSPLGAAMALKRLARDKPRRRTA